MKFLIGLQDIVGLNDLQGNNCSWCGTHNGWAITSSGLPTASSRCITERKTYWESRINCWNVKGLKPVLFDWWIWWIWSPCLFIAWGPWSILVVFYHVCNCILLVIVVDHLAQYSCFLGGSFTWDHPFDFFKGKSCCRRCEEFAHSYSSGKLVENLTHMKML